jgi:hypothetical protein
MVAMAGCAVSNAGDDQTAEQSIKAGGGKDIPGVPVTLKPGVHDPGPRGGAPAAGKHVAGLDKNATAMFNEGRFRAREVKATCDGCANITTGSEIPPGGDPNFDANASGAGARFDGISCNLGCHSQPDIGGTSPAVNPSFQAAHFRGAINTVPFFETIDGPTRDARFQFNPDGTRDGTVHQKFTVKGRTDAPDCVSIAQPDFAGNADNLAFRIPTALFGLGLIDSLQDSEILANHDATALERAQLGIGGVASRNGNGSINRLGWKAQSKSISEFTSADENLELGTTTDLDPLPRTSEVDGCNLLPQPADLVHTGAGTATDPTSDFDQPTKTVSVWQAIQMFVRLLDQPKQATLGVSAQRGQQLFTDIGCADCHTPGMHTKAGELGSIFPQLRDTNVALYSDLLVHDMGSRLADNVIQGSAGPDMFRTAPLWGLGQRLFFLHDGRSTTLDDAILQHYADPTAASGRNPAYPASEANQVILSYGALDAQGQQDILNFLRRL